MSSLENDKKELSLDNVMKKSKLFLSGLSFHARMALFVILLFTISVTLFCYGNHLMLTGFSSVYTTEKDAAYEAQWEKYYNRAEQSYHVSNQISVSIVDLEATGKLEVLDVSDVEYVVQDANSDNHNITSWLEVPGSGTYTVDLEAAEFVIDNMHNYVLARLPEPEISNISIDYKNVKKLFFKNDLFNDSYAVGEDLAREQLATADSLIKEELTSNRSFFESAENAAKISVSCLIRQLNPDVPDLTVEVEFY